MINVIVLDIEGTTSPTSSVRDELYGYTRTRLPGWLDENCSGAAESIIAETRTLAEQPDASVAAVAAILINWLNTDVKAEPLKSAQGIICAEGFRNGSLYGEFFPDVPPMLRAWRESGLELYIYSSGSVRNQKDWFAYARPGNLSPLITGHFDLTTAGPKREASSYEKIAGTIGVPAESILFLSDHSDELDAAVAAGWQAIGVSRPGEPNPPRPPHPWISDFADIEPNPPRE
ncbi:acireductone synthase [Nocardia sp. SYP-A9097]|uniref:acireductone synthase n=1 Tax=Nocardia sp. SYP-A9097 TaxID=2663237 RepID=UPI00129C0E9B|nr:acireductone synthase [Nocardia sp. SYP-A9097]MRH90644.1 acireductone synthase [Nocardia sp. SYP-A9097]